MPVYFFDRIENGEVARGEHGMEFATLQDARRDALRALTEIARDELAEHSEGCELIIYIRQDDGQPILSVSLSVHVNMESGHPANVSTPATKTILN